MTGADNLRRAYESRLREWAWRVRRRWLVVVALLDSMVDALTELALLQYRIGLCKVAMFGLEEWQKPAGRKYVQDLRDQCDALRHAHGFRTNINPGAELELLGVHEEYR